MKRGRTIERVGGFEYHGILGLIVYFTLVHVTNIRYFSQDCAHFVLIPHSSILNWFRIKSLGGLVNTFMLD
jgi:hypothetical protein